MKHGKNIFLLLALLLAAVTLLLVTGCSNDDNSVDTKAEDPVQLTRFGWRQFEEADFDSALINFNKAIGLGYESADPYSGAGWCLFEKGTDLDDATAYWQLGLNRPGGTYDILVGLGFVSDAQNRFDDCISYMQQVLDLNANYEFEHAPGIDYLDIRWTIAKNYLLNGDFENSYIWVQQLNEFFYADVATPEGRTALTEEIERLGELIRG